MSGGRPTLTTSHLVVNLNKCVMCGAGGGSSLTDTLNPLEWVFGDPSTSPTSLRLARPLSSAHRGSPEGVFTWAGRLNVILPLTRGPRRPEDPNPNINLRHKFIV